MKSMFGVAPEVDAEYCFKNIYLPRVISTLHRSIGALTITCRHLWYQSVSSCYTLYGHTSTFFTPAAAAEKGRECSIASALCSVSLASNIPVSRTKVISLQLLVFCFLLVFSHCFLSSLDFLWTKQYHNVVPHVVICSRRRCQARFLQCCWCEWWTCRYTIQSYHSSQYICQ